MDELVRWLGVQLDQDKARAAQWHDLECSIHEHQEGGLLKAVAALEVYGEVPGAVCDCGGPARVLREIDAKRQLLAGYDKAVHAVEECSALRDRLHARGVDVSMTEMDLETAIHRRDTLSGVVRLLALPYAARPGYKESWRP